MHWPNVARTGILQVKEWETTLTSDYGIFLNLREEDLPTNAWYFLTEFLVELAASLSHFFAVQNETIAFYCNGKPFGAGEGPFRLPPKRGRHLVEKILTYLAGVSPGQGQAVEVFFREAARLPARSILLFLTPVITPVMVEKAAHLRRNGFQPVFLWPYYRDGVLPTTDLRKANLKWYIVRKGVTGMNLPSQVESGTFPLGYSAYRPFFAGCLCSWSPASFRLVYIGPIRSPLWRCSFYWQWAGVSMR